MPSPRCCSPRCVPTPTTASRRRLPRHPRGPDRRDLLGTYVVRHRGDDAGHPGRAVPCVGARPGAARVALLRGDRRGTRRHRTRGSPRRAIVIAASLYGGFIAMAGLMPSFWLASASSPSPAPPMVSAVFRATVWKRTHPRHDERPPRPSRCCPTPSDRWWVRRGPLRRRARGRSGARSSAAARPASAACSSSLRHAPRLLELRLPHGARTPSLSASVAPGADPE